MTAIASAVGVLIGVVSTSVLLGVILVIYGGNQVVGIAMLPMINNFSGSSLLTYAGAAVIAGLAMVVAVHLFNRQQF
jgi:hypothetical protein